MSTDSSTNHEPPTDTTITLTHGDKWWVAKDEEAGVVSQDKNRQDALENLDEALQGYHGEGEPPSDEDLRELGINPERNTPDSLNDLEIFD